jgi:hypothetical protein
VDEEEATIRAFMRPDRRERWVSGLASPKRRRKTVAGLAHSPDLDPRFAHRVSPATQTADGILSALLTRKAPTSCRVISEDLDLDGTELPLDQAVTRIVGYTFGSLIICRPGRLAYYEGEEQGERYILERS